MIELPDDLYAKVTARVASLSRSVPEVTVELYERWLVDGNGSALATPDHGASAEWLEEWFHAADEVISLTPAGPSARELLLQDRQRLLQAR